MIKQANSSQQIISSEVKFYRIEDLKELLPWSEQTLQKMFNAPDFPSVDYGKCKVVEAHALIDFFSTKHSKENEAYWKLT